MRGEGSWKGRDCGRGPSHDDRHGRDNHADRDRDGRHDWDDRRDRHDRCDRDDGKRGDKGDDHDGGDDGDGAGATIVRVSTSASGQQANGSNDDVSLSADAGKVAFVSNASNLVPGDTNGVSDVFVKALATGAVTRASTSASGQQANGASIDLALSADGTAVAFRSAATNLVEGDANGVLDIFVKNLVTGAITRASTSASGEEANGESIEPSLSADGTRVVFISGASNLVPGDTNGIPDIFVKDLVTGAITRASTSAGGEQANAGSGRAEFSADGRFVAFGSDASNLVPGDTNAFTDLFIKDLETGAIALVSTAADGGPADGFSYIGSDDPSLSADGRVVVFISGAGNLVQGGNQGFFDLIVRNLDTGATTEADTSATGESENGFGVSGGSLSGDGGRVAFASIASNLVPGENLPSSPLNIFVKDLDTGAIVLASASAGGERGNGNSGSPSLSADGRVVAFSSFASNLVPGDTNGTSDVFLRVLDGGTGIPPGDPGPKDPHVPPAGGWFPAPPDDCVWG